MSRCESAHQQDRVEWRARCRLTWIRLGRDDGELFALNNSPCDGGIEERRNYENAGTDGLARADLVEARTCLVDFVVDLDFPAHAVEVTDLVWSVRPARNVREEEAIALRRRNADQPTRHFSRATTDGHVRIDRVPVENYDVLFEQRVEVRTFDSVTERGTSNETIHCRLPILFEPHHEPDIVHFTFGKALNARIAEVDE